jgi:hypothetical protein
MQNGIASVPQVNERTDMKPREWFGILVATALTVSAIGIAVAQERTAFHRPDALAGALDSSPGRAIHVLETILTQEQADTFEQAMLPPPSDEEKLEALRQIKTQLEAADATTEIKTALDEEINALEAQLQQLEPVK